MKIPICLVFGFLLMTQVTRAAVPDDIRRELEDMLDDDIWMETQLREVYRAEYFNEAEEQDLTIRRTSIADQHLQRLAVIVARYGWPRREEVGEAAAEGTWRAVWYAGPGKQKPWLPILKEQVSLFELDAAMVAEIEDRVLVHEGKPQVYGTQFIDDPDSAKRRLHPVDDCTRVAERRRIAGMKPLSRHLVELGARENPCPGIE